MGQDERQVIIDPRRKADSIQDSVAGGLDEFARVQLKRCLKDLFNVAESRLSGGQQPRFGHYTCEDTT